MQDTSIEYSYKATGKFSYDINCGVLQGFPALRKAVRYFLTVNDIDDAMFKVMFDSFMERLP